LHELSLAYDVVQILCEEGRRNDITRIERFRLEVGSLRAVVPDFLRTSLEFASKGTMAEGAIVDIIKVEGRALCTGCGHEYAAEEIFHCCPLCQRTGGRILAGEELRIIDLEGE
jgi:hydrogenase nickel incorporation protein HypA/HybF